MPHPGRRLWLAPAVIALGALFYLTMRLLPGRAAHAPQPANGQARRLAAAAARQLGYALPFPEGPRHVTALTADVMPAAGEEIVLGVTLAKNTGFVAVMAGRPPRLQGWARDLAEVFRLDTFDLPDSRQRGILVEEHHNNMFGAYTRATTVRLVRWRGEGPLDELWSGVKESVAYWNEAWDNPGRPARWLRATEHADISPPIHGRFSVHRIKTIGHGEGPPGQIPRRFVTDKSVEQTVTFLWDHRLGRFMEQR